MTPLTARTGLRLLALALAAGLLAGGCAAATADQGSGPDPVESADFGPDGPGPSDTPDPALSGQPVPTLPPGDPGTGPDDGTGDEDGRHEGDDGHHDEEGEDGTLTDVPAAALLDAGTVGALAGGTWAPDPRAAEDCLTAEAEGAAASRSAVLVSDDGRLVQAVSTMPTRPGERAVGTAKDAVDSLTAALVACGFTEAGDPRLGDASTALERAGGAAGGIERAVVIAAEGATLVLTGSGSAAADGVWESLSDVAMGTLCAAGAHGCH